MERYARLLKLLSLLLFVSTGAWADYDQQRAKLEALREEIRRIEGELETQRARHSGLGAELRGMDERIAGVAAALNRLQQEMSNKEMRVAQLRREQAAERARMEDQRKLLAEQLRMAYVGGRQEYLRLLLNQEDPARLDRQLAYYGYLNRARGDKIGAALAQLRRLGIIAHSLDQELNQLAQLRERTAAEREHLQQARRERAEHLARVEAEITAKGAELSRRQDDARGLEKLLSRLQDALADVEASPREREPFASLSGRLQWPLRGEIAARFDSPRGVGDLRWAGLLIEAGAGKDVRSVAHGHVVFADWLRGFGLLLIIDHGDGYLSLYGHNEAIYKETGDWVQAGEVIATVGASGGRRAPGLYFEIRAAGKPVDPLAWLSN